MNEKLKGGNMSTVIKKGDAIYRNQGPWSSTIHRFLLHLEAVGFTDCPKFIGIDENNNEILTYVEGECLQSYPKYINESLHLKGIASLANIMKNFHQASSTFLTSNDDKWIKGNLEKDIICHNDIAPYNMTFKNQLPYKMIDFDTCCPAPRIWDIVYAIYRFVPISNKEYSDTYINKCISTFFTTYGIAYPETFFVIMIERLEALIHTIQTGASNNELAFKNMVAEGHVEFYENEIAYIKKRYSK